MKVKLTKGRSATKDDVSALQGVIGRPLSPDVLAFFAESDGAEPETNIFKINNGNESGVNDFIPVKKIANEIRAIGSLPSGAYPIAWAEGGNYIIVNETENGAVFFWEHEKVDGVVRLASNFNSFLRMLEPFDINSIELKPGQVKKAWIDPDFLKDIQG
jgi:hypothetical protein